VRDTFMTTLMKPHRLGLVARAQGISVAQLFDETRCPAFCLPKPTWRQVSAFVERLSWGNIE